MLKRADKKKPRTQRTLRKVWTATYGKFEDTKEVIMKVQTMIYIALHRNES